MKNTDVKLQGVASVLLSADTAKEMCTLPGIHKVEINLETGTATVYHFESVPMEEIRCIVIECGCTLSSENQVETVSKPLREKQRLK